MNYQPTDLSLDTNKVITQLTDFISSEINKAGFSKAVLGLSGGIDSALVAFLTAKAIGKENLLGIRLPYKTSSQASLDHAQLVIDALGIPNKTIPVTPMADALIDQIPDMDALRKGNIMARCRMITLFDQSADWRGLVMGTGNKTEILLGYTTLFGDSACAINPVGDLYKTQVRQLSRALGVPQAIIDKAPSADLWSGQTDEKELGFSYDDVDQLLYHIVDLGETPDQVEKAGFAPEFVTAVSKRIRANHFKRVPAPIPVVFPNVAVPDLSALQNWGK